jgi:transcriptional regulator with PAS, ATPase and Fis domain
MSDQTLAKVHPIIVRYSKIRISVVAGPDTGLEREIINAALRIGTAADNDLVLSDSSVSRRHCAIEPLAAGVRIRDEGSTNGVFVGALRVVEVIATDALVIQLGDTKVRIEPLTDIVEREQLASERFGDMLGSSARMRELFADLLRIAQTDVTLLIEGETGTGKELVADAVHRASPRAAKPYVVFDCSAVVPTLIESELFGTVPGAYNGAVNRPGVFEQAHGGTIFIDELGELPKELQPKLLRVLQERVVRRLGSERTREVDVRVISATNRNLAAEVKRGNFREDLYFRLATAEVHVPPLRDRIDDLPILVNHFLKRAQSDLTVERLAESVWNMFLHHRWPGNVRELSNAVQRLLVTPDRIFTSKDVPAEVVKVASPSTGAAEDLPPLRVARREASERFEEQYVRALLERSGGSRKKAAATADVSREMIRKLLIKHGLE